MTKKELKEMMEEIRTEQAAAKKSSITKEDLKEIMKEFMADSAPKNDDKDDKPEPKGEKLDKPVEVAEKAEETPLSKDDIKSFMKEFAAKPEEHKVKEQVVEAQGGGKMTLFKETDTAKGFGF